MPRAVPNSSLHRRNSTPVRLIWEDDAELRELLEMKQLPEGFLQRLEHLVAICRQSISCKVPTPAESALTQASIAEHARVLLDMLGCAGDAQADPLAGVCRDLPGGLRELRATQASIERLMFAAERAQRAVPTLRISVGSAKRTLAAGTAALLSDNGIRPTLTVEPPSTYYRIVEWALHRADPGAPGDLNRIAVDGLRAWCGQVVE